MIDAMLVYLLVMIGGAAFLFIMFLLGGFGDTSFEGGAGGDVGHFDMGHADGGGHDAGGGHAEVGGGSETVHLSPMSPTLLAFAITSFGAFGMILTVGMPSLAPWTIGIIAMVCAAITAGAIFYLLLTYLGKAQASSMYKTSELVGKIAEVTVKIPKGGTGTVDYEIRGQRTTSSAKANEEIAQGITVRIKKTVGNILFVEKAADSDDGKEAKEGKEEKGEKGGD